MANKLKAKRRNSIVPECPDIFFGIIGPLKFLPAPRLKNQLAPSFFTEITIFPHTIVNSLSHKPGSVLSIVQNWTLGQKLAPTV